jgi:putative oxidoreductase
MNLLPEKWLKKNQDFAILLLRLFTGIRLIYGVMDNVVSWKHMEAFRDFLSANHFPFPMVCAVISVYAQLLAGLMFIAGFKIRIAAILMIINFTVAIIMVHRNDSFEGMTPALAILFSSIVFLFYGAGKLAIRD